MSSQSNGEMATVGGGETGSSGGVRLQPGAAAALVATANEAADCAAAVHLQLGLAVDKAAGHPELQELLVKIKMIASESTKKQAAVMNALRRYDPADHLNGR